MKKAALLVFPIVFMLLFQATGFLVYAAEKGSTSKYDIQFEKLAGTEDAKEFNSYRNELLSYFNQQIRSEFSYKLTVLKKSDIDFNNEELVQGYKVWGNFTDYSVKNSYDNVMKQLSKQDYNWYISIKTAKTAVFAIICPSDKKTMNNDYFYFGDDDEWCVIWCWVSKSQGKEGAHEISAVVSYYFYDEAEAILNKFIKSDKDDDIKVVYAHIGQSNEYYHNYMLGGIVFINGRATYIYSNCFGLYGDMVEKDTPENIKNLLEICSSKMYNNRNGYKDIKQLFDYDFVMTLIKIYEEYALY